MDNMAIWEKVQKTDPKHTKRVNQRGGFTAIDAHYQVETATRTFGPVGIGWGYDCEYKTVSPLIMCELTLWHETRENRYGPICGAALIDSNGRIDADAPKKAMTDALTKALSHL